MKATLEFNLPEDQNEFEMVNNASKTYSVIWDLQQWLRSQTKHAPDTMSDDTYNTFEKCREKLNDLLIDNNLDLTQ
jgi:hypothetical protein